jgi:hypothetical protein
MVRFLMTGSYQRELLALGAGRPWPIDFSRAAALVIASSGRATSISFRGATTGGEGGSDTGREDRPSGHANQEARSGGACRPVHFDERRARAPRVLP